MSVVPLRKSLSPEAFASLMEIHEDCPEWLESLANLLSRRNRPLHGTIVVTLRSAKIIRLVREESFQAREEVGPGLDKGGFDRVD